MPIRVLRVAAAAGLAAMSVVGIVAGPAVADHRLSGKVQEYYWTWSDSLRFAPRTFIQTDFLTPASLPKLVVTVVPATPSQMVYLQFRQGGRWVDENIVRTDPRGVAVVDVDPFCSNDTWCNGIYQYRLLVGGITAPVSISFFKH